MSGLRTEFERPHPVPVTLRWDDVSQQYACKHWSAEHAEIKWNSLWQGFQSGHAAGLEQQAARIAELEASLADAIEGQQVLGLKLAQAEGHSPTALGGPTPVTVAAPACERQE